MSHQKRSYDGLFLLQCMWHKNTRKTFPGRNKRSVISPKTITSLGHLSSYYLQLIGRMHVKVVRKYKILFALFIINNKPRRRAVVFVPNFSNLGFVTTSFASRCNISTILLEKYAAHSNRFICASLE